MSSRARRFIDAIVIAVSVLGALAGCAASTPVDQGAAPERLAADIRESVLRVPAAVFDAFGNKLSADLLVTTYRPPGPGPFPLVVISHGRSVKGRADYKRPRFESAARFFVRKGFAVAVPLRIGYGELAAVGDPESSLRCDSPRYDVPAKVAAEQIAAVVKAITASDDIDAHRVVLLGQSVGGFATIAATAVHIDGVVAAIDFAGGHGGDPDQHAGEPCGTAQLRRSFADFGRRAAQGGHAVPTLWVFAENDRYFSPRYQKQWSETYRDAGGLVETRLMPAFGSDGHQLFGQGNDIWQPLVDEFLKPLGFTTPGVVAVPAARDGVAVDDETALPQSSLLSGYRKFLAAKEPRAFATDGSHWGYASGDDAPSRALAFCERKAEADAPCRLYAVDHAVVWKQP